jgi:hypothetical protein
VKAVRLDRRSVDTEILTVIMTANYEAVLLVMRKSSLAKIREAIAAGLRINVNLILEGIFSSFDLKLNLFSFPLEPIGNVRKFGLALISLKASVLGKIPSFSAFLTENVCAL